MKITSFIHPSRTFTPCSGVGRHVNNILLELQNRDDIELSLLFSKQWLSGGNKLPENAPLRNIPFRTFLLRERMLERSWKALNWPKMDSFTDGAQWIFSPAETYIPLKKTRSAITLHDVQAFEDDLPWSQSTAHQTFRRRWELWVPKLVRHTDLIFTVSEYSRQRIITRLGLPESKVRISGNAVDPVFLTQVGFIPKKVTDFPYLAVVGGFRPKKGGAELLQVARKLLKAWPEVRLVTWGENDPLLTRQAKELPNIIALDMIPDAEMIAWMKGAQASIFLSWYEGFGFPVLESMACGTPVICSNKASLPEVANGAALMASPDETDKIVDFILQTRSTSVSEDLRQKGYRNVQRYSWATTAENVAKALKEY